MCVLLHWGSHLRLQVSATAGVAVLLGDVQLACVAVPQLNCKERWSGPACVAGLLSSLSGYCPADTFARGIGALH